MKKKLLFIIACSFAYLTPCFPYKKKEDITKLLTHARDELCHWETYGQAISDISLVFSQREVFCEKECERKLFECIKKAHQKYFQHFHRGSCICYPQELLEKAIEKWEGSAYALKLGTLVKEFHEKQKEEAIDKNLEEADEKDAFISPSFQTTISEEKSRVSIKNEISPLEKEVTFTSPFSLPLLLPSRNPRKGQKGAKKKKAENRALKGKKESKKKDVESTFSSTQEMSETEKKENAQDTKSTKKKKPTKKQEKVALAKEEPLNDSSALSSKPQGKKGKAKEPKNKKQKSKTE